MIFHKIKTPLKMFLVRKAIFNDNFVTLCHRYVTTFLKFFFIHFEKTNDINIDSQIITLHHSLHLIVFPNGRKVDIS